tara:strand:- start:15324 stop:15614 length:291 start_codon:yes stop_codon:yes gene_type:complete
MNYELYGTREDLIYNGYDNPNETVYIEELLATFDTKKLAEKYTEDSLLKAAKKQYFYPDLDRGKYKYKRESLLRYYDGYDIRPRVVEPEPPNNPKI